MHPIQFQKVYDIFNLYFHTKCIQQFLGGDETFFKLPLFVIWRKAHVNGWGGTEDVVMVWNCTPFQIALSNEANTTSIHSPLQNYPSKNTEICNTPSSYFTKYAMYNTCKSTVHAYGNWRILEARKNSTSEEQPHNLVIF